MTRARVRYFAYGSNLDADQMRERCPSSRVIARARLDGHRLGFTHFSKRWGGGSADLIPEPDAVVWGVVYGLDADDLERLDRFEGGYERILVQLDVYPAGDEAAFEAISYQVREKQPHAPRDLYLAKMLHWGEHWELPASYLEALRGIATTS
jgi:gamma-glutamylcyclotransferase (GGCT)/AIG2-like uncharacterized protein YtfP